MWLGLAVGAHLVLTQADSNTHLDRVSKPLTTQFVKRQPRLTKPLELKRRPEPKPRSVQRKMVSVKARSAVQQRAARFQASELMMGLARPAVHLGRTAPVGIVQAESYALAGVIEGEREAEQKIDMCLELLDIEALDTGKYHALVIQDPADKKGVRGFCRLGAIFHSRFFPQMDLGTAGTLGTQYEYMVGIGLTRLVRYVNEATEVKTELLGRIRLLDDALLKVPWALFSPTVCFELSDMERSNLGAYLLGGGFLFADGQDHPTSWYGVWKAAFLSLRRELLASLRTQGVSCAIEKLPNTHPIYHCYFDFDGPGMACDSAHKALHPELAHVLGYAEGIELAGRMLAFVTGKGYAEGWNVIGQRGVAQDWDATPSFRFGANTIIFALTQEGSITCRLMESVR